MPARKRCAGEWMAPQERITSLARNSVRTPFERATTPTQRRPSNSSSDTCVSVAMVEVAAHARAGIEVADGGRHAPLVGVGDGDRIVAVAPLAVLVGQVLEARRLEGLGGGLGVAGPQLGEDAPHGNAPLLAVQRALEVHVALDLLVVGQHVRPAPAARAAGYPLLEVGRRAAVGELAVDGGAAAQDARLLVFAQRRRALLGIVVGDDLGAHLELGPVDSAGRSRRCRDSCRAPRAAPCRAACPGRPPAGAPGWRSWRRGGWPAPSPPSRRRR